MKIIDKITSERYFKDISENSDTFMISVIGSLLREDYIEGWSDIDLVIVTHTNSLSYFGLVNNYIKDVSKLTEVKVGVEVVPLSVIEKNAKRKICPGGTVKIAKNFYKDSLMWKKGILYVKKNVVIPKFNLASIKKESVLAYALGVVDYMNKFMLANSDLKDRKLILRKIIKNSLLLIQTDLIIETEELTVDFTLALQSFKSLFNFDLRVLEESFDRRFLWKTLKDGDIDKKEIENNWKVFNVLSNFIIERC